MRKFILTVLLISLTFVNAEAINKGEVEYDTPYDYYYGLISLACEIEDLPFDVVFSISRLETGNFTSKAFTEYHNFGGLMSNGSIMKFDTEPQGLQAFMDTCQTYKKRFGELTPETMAKIYCPDNSKWCDLVRQIMTEVNNYEN